MDVANRLADSWIRPPWGFPDRKLYPRRDIVSSGMIR